MSGLKHEFVTVETKDGKTYGGNQKNFPYRFLQKSGCGVVSSTDLLLYLSKYHKEYSSSEFPQKSSDEISLEEYNQYAKKIWGKYVPVIPGFGINGLFLMLGLNLYFLCHRIPLLARWGVRPRRLWLSMDAMFANGIPVILAIGPNFPCIWKKEKLNFYIKKGNQYIPACKTKAHYVTVVGRDGKWIRISSWGKEYYINGEEYREYVRKHSSYLVSNILYIKKKSLYTR